MSHTTVITLPETPVSLLTVPQPRVSVITAGTGLQGPPGPPGGSTSSSFIAGADLSGHIAVAFNSDGTCIPADCTVLSGHAVVGVTTGAAVQGALATVATGDTLQHIGWTFSTGDPVLLGANGALTQSLPEGALFTKVIGVALSATRLAIDFQPAIFH